MLEMRELVPFTEAKCRVLPLWCWLWPCRNPAGPEAAPSGSRHRQEIGVVPASVRAALLPSARILPTSHAGCDARCSITHEKSGEQTKKKPKPLIHPISLPLQPFYSSPPRGCAPQAESLYYKEHVVQKHLITRQRHLHSMLASQQINS